MGLTPTLTRTVLAPTLSAFIEQHPNVLVRVLDAYSDVVLEKITMDIAFIGVNGIDPIVGATVHDEGEASVNSLMARRATRAVVVADSSKIGRTAFATLGGPKVLTTLITDDGITDEQRAAFVEHGIDVIVA